MHTRAIMKIDESQSHYVGQGQIWKYRIDGMPNIVNFVGTRNVLSMRRTAFVNSMPLIIQYINILYGISDLQIQCIGILVT